ncbi:MAG: rhomboid family intramembrane serine protease [candidate division Zixibacteria bacterium]|nr:rhomboid family intramembrane serine protease [candidate division Zixibacteria bacterium]
MFFPIKDDMPTIRKPYLTIALIVINSIIFLYSQLLGDRGFNLFIIQYGYIPFELVHSIELTPGLPSSVFYTVFSSMFMHGGWLHLIGNMLFLWIYGNNVEDYFGRVKFIIFYLVSGLAAIGLYTLFGPNSQVPLVGASGAIAGLMGAYIVLHPRAKITCLVVFFFIQFITLQAKVVLWFWFGYQLLMSLAGSSTGGGVAYLAHVGGFLFGLGLLKFLTRGGRRSGGSATDGQRVYRVHWQ